jgi:hypothetical protein
MAGTEYGKDWTISFGTTGDPETFTSLGGEGSFDWKTATDKIDLSTKGDGQLKAQGFGQSTYDFTITGKLKVPDAGMSLGYTASLASPPLIDMQIKKGAVIKYQGQVGIGNFSISAPNGDAVSFSFDASATQVPTVNNLMAVAA